MDCSRGVRLAAVPVSRAAAVFTHLSSPGPEAVASSSTAGAEAMFA